MTRDQYAPTDSDARDVTARDCLICRDFADSENLRNFTNSENSRTISFCCHLITHALLLTTTCWMSTVGSHSMGLSLAHRITIQYEYFLVNTRRHYLFWRWTVLNFRSRTAKIIIVREHALHAAAIVSTFLLKPLRSSRQ